MHAKYGFVYAHVNYRMRSKLRSYLSRVIDSNFFMIYGDSNYVLGSHEKKKILISYFCTSLEFRSMMVGNDVVEIEQKGNIYTW